MKRMGAKPNKELISTMLLTILHGVGSIHQNTNVTTRTFNRGEEIVKRLVQYIIKHYTKERSVAFYADLLHISPQHLSTTVNKITGKTVTDIIAKLVITDAEAKLKSTDFTIQEIAYSLNFPDISFFGKYFKDIQECHRNSIGRAHNNAHSPYNTVSVIHAKHWLSIWKHHY